MTKSELLSLMRLLSALEAAILCSSKALPHYLPDYLLEQISGSVEVLEREILKP